MATVSICSDFGAQKIKSDTVSTLSLHDALPIFIPSKEIPGLISFRMDWLDLLAVQGTLKNLLQHHSSKASILQRSAFFTVQLSHPYMTTGKTVALTKRTFVGKVMSLLFNMLSRLVITFLPRSKRLSISWLQSPSVVILEPRKIKSDTVSTVSPSICHALESLLDCKEVQPVHSEGDQPWDFFGRNDAKAETPVLWPPHAKI